MLTFEQIKELIELVSTNRLAEVQLERSGFRLKIEGERPVTFQDTSGSTAPSAVLTTGAAGPVSVPAAVPAAASAATPTAAAQTAPAGAEGDNDGVPEDAHILTSPIVGTFYAASNPEAPPFVEVGDTVSVGKVLCIVEAMKLMNEIESDVDGEILKIFPKNAQAVEFGEPLFAIRTR